MNKHGCIALQIKPGEETIKYKKDLVVKKEASLL